MPRPGDCRPGWERRSIARHTPEPTADEARQAPRTWRGWTIVGLAAFGIGVSGYLTSIHYGGSLALCTGAGGCEAVQASRYSVVAGVPVALSGLLLYLAILGLGFWRIRAADTTPGPVSLGMFGLAFAGVLYSVYLTYLELFVIDAICPWCVTSALLIGGICVLSAWDLRALGQESDLEVEPGADS